MSGNPEDSGAEFMKTGEIGPLFNKGPRWFERHHKRLYDEGFPRPVSRGCYLRSAVLEFRDKQYGSRHEQANELQIRGPEPSVVDVQGAIDRTLGRTKEPRHQGDEG